MHNCSHQTCAMLTCRLKAGLVWAGQAHTCAWKQQLCRAEAHPQRRLGLLSVSWDARAGSWDPPEAGDTSRVRPSLNCVTLFTTDARCAKGSLSSLLEPDVAATAAPELWAAEELRTRSCRMTALHSKRTTP